MRAIYRHRLVAPVLSFKTNQGGGPAAPANRLLWKTGDRLLWQNILDIESAFLWSL
jgi:hypothetical protein